MPYNTICSNQSTSVPRNVTVHLGPFFMQRDFKTFEVDDLWKPKFVEN